MHYECIHAAPTSHRMLIMFPGCKFKAFYSHVPPLQEYQSIVDAEWNILYDKLDRIHKSGAKVVLSKLPIGDVATQYFADR